MVREVEHTNAVIEQEQCTRFLRDETSRFDETSTEVGDA